MPLNADISAALQLLEHIQASIEHGDDPKLQAHTADDLQLLISVLENPILRSIVNIQDSLGELNVQLQQHPSLLPVDFDINPSGDLVLSLPAGGPPNVDLYPGVGSTTPFEVDDGLEVDYDVPVSRVPDDQRVPVAKLSHSSSGDTVSPPSAAPMADGSLGGAPPPILPPPITTPTYALEFKRAVEESSQGRQILTVKLFKPDGASLGFSVVGLRSEERGELGIFVQEIQQQGIAGRDGSLHEGDQIIAIDGQPLDSNISHQQAISILHEARGPVELVVARASVPPPLLAAAAAAASAAASAAVAASAAAAAAASSASNHSNNADQSQQSTGAALPPTPLSASSSSAAITVLSAPGQRTPTNSVITGIAEPNNKAEMVLNTEWAQVEIIDLVNDGSGLGFGIIGGRSTGVVVKTILPGGVADRDGRLQSGDHILQIGEVNLRGMGSEQVAAVLRQSGSRVRLVVARPVEPSSPDYQSLGSHAPIVPTEILSDPDELDRHLVQNGYPEAFRVPLDDDGSPDTEGLIGGVTLYPDTEIDFHPEPGLVVDVVRAPGAPPLPTLTLDLASAVVDGPLPEMDTFTVELRKDLHGLGITIAGYVCEKEELSGIFVKSISEGSAADLCKKIQVNDRIVEVDGRSLQGYTNHQAVEVLRATGQTVILRLERYLRGPKYEQLQLAIANSELKPPTPGSPSASATSLPRFPISTDGEDETEIVLDGESHTTVDSLILEGVGGIVCYDDSVLAATSLVDSSSPDDPIIDCNYTGMLRPEVEAAIKNKWMSVLGPDVEIVVAQLCKFEKGGGLGISLEGTVDVEDGQEVRPHHYIRSILPDGPVGQNRRLSSGDELLEVNGHRLLGMNHIEVVTILKELPVYVRMVCARRTGDVAVHRLIDTSQDRAAFAARSLLGGSLQNLIPATDRLVKAKSDGSLASTTTTATATETSLGKMKSRSLEPLTGLAMWSSEPQVIELTKGDGGLGFSILDYQDPMNPNETVIVIRSLVPGGVAKLDGRLIPGDRLLFVNDIALENASLDQAVQALKGAPRGVVRIGVAKPLPIPDSLSQSQVRPPPSPPPPPPPPPPPQSSPPSDGFEEISAAAAAAAAAAGQSLVKSESF